MQLGLFTFKVQKTNKTTRQKTSNNFKKQIMDLSFASSIPSIAAHTASKY